MKSKRIIQLVMMLCVISPYVALAQFSSGSTGADGTLNVTIPTTLVLPTNGVFNFTTINVSANLFFTKNALNTPAYLLATRNVVINGNIIIDGGNAGLPSSSIAGLGGLGGFDGGQGGVQGFLLGDGQGPGGGLAEVDQRAVFGLLLPSGNSNIYGNTLLVPLIGGSGGAGRSVNGGGGGGGAILLASSTKITMTGGIYARGGNGANTVGLVAGGGSGGSIRLVAPVVDGTGELQTFGGSGVNGRGGFGRVRIDTLDRFAWRTLNLANAGKWTVGIQMFVFPPGNPKLDIISAASTPIIEGTNAPVIVYLPVGVNSNQLVRVQARNFTNDIPIRVKITPENAPSATFDGIIQQSSGNPPFADVQVTLPVDTVCHVHAWTR